MKWVKSGANWMGYTWMCDSQVIYKLERNPLSLSEHWAVLRRVSGAASPTPTIVGTSTDLADAKLMAEQDSLLPL